MLEEHAIVDLMRELENKIDVTDLCTITKTTKEHFIEWLGKCPPWRLFEEQPKKLRTRNRNRITIILGNPCVRVIWQGIEITKEVNVATNQ